MKTERRRQAVAFFLSQGWTLPQAAGIAANLEAESGWNERAVGDGGSARGLPQWWPDRQSYVAALLGKPFDQLTFEDQLYGVAAELRGPEKKAGDALALCTTAAEAAEVVCRQFERPKNPDKDSITRAAIANDILQEYTQAEPTGPQAPPPHPGPSPTSPSQGRRMDPLSIIGIFGSALTTLLPQLGKLFRPEDAKMQRNMAALQLVLDTFTKAALNNPQASGGNLAQVAQAVEAVQADPALKQTVTAAVLTTPGIIEFLEVGEIGGGIVKAREFSVEVQNAERPFWFNPTFWITFLFFPMMYMITYQVLFTMSGPVSIGTGVEGQALVPTPWYAQIGFDPNTRTGLINLIVGFVFGGVCGIWFGTTIAKQRAENAAATKVIEDRRAP